LHLTESEFALLNTVTVETWLEKAAGTAELLLRAKLEALAVVGLVVGFVIGLSLVVDDASPNPPMLEDTAD
jgi:esterase/lipase